MRKKRIFLVVICVFIILTMLLTVTVTASAQEKEKNVSPDIITIIKGIFGDKKIDSVEYLYGFDDVADYIYVDFKNYGYAIFFKDTMEMLEYAPLGKLPFDKTNERKYYAGPRNSYVKKEEKFVNLFTDEALVLSKEEAKDYSKQISKKLASIKQESKYEISAQAIEEINKRRGFVEEGVRAIPDQGDNNFIQADPPGTVGSTYVPHPEYFLAEPEFGGNRHGTCGSVAVQLLLSYHNYYTDRRIIAPEHLNGGWLGDLGNGDKFDPENYQSPEDDPNVCYNPDSKTSLILGSRSGQYVYNYIVNEYLYELDPNGFYANVINEVEPSALNCVCTYVKTVVNQSTGIATDTTIVFYPDGTYSISEPTNRPAENGEKSRIKSRTHTHPGSTKGQIETGLNNILSQKLGSTSFSVDSHEGFLWGAFALNSSYVTEQIDAGNPVIIIMKERLGGADHVAVAYGYQEYTYPNNGGTYLGYVVHYGWQNEIGERRDRIWINKSWCSACVTLELSHQVHTYVGTGKIVSQPEEIFEVLGEYVVIFNQYQELRCSVCGHRALGNLFTRNGSKITGTTCALSGEITIPYEIDGVTITEIGEGAFANQNITSVNIPYTIVAIKDYAFKNCSNLERVDYRHPDAMTRPENQSNLSIIGKNAFLGCSALTSIIIPRAVETIDDGAFKNCTNLSTVQFYQTIWLVIGSIHAQLSTIGNDAFLGCSALTAISIPESVEIIGDRAFKNCINLAQVSLYKTFELLGLTFVGSDLESIGSEAFVGCPSLISIDLPESVTQIGFSAFDSSVELDENSAIVRANVDLIIPEGTTATYQTNGWTGFNYVEYRLTSAGALKVVSGQLHGGIVIPSTLNEVLISSIDSSAFANQTQLTSVKIPSGRVTSIGSNAFSNCTSLENVDIQSEDLNTNVPDHTTSYVDYYYTERCLNVRLEAGCIYRLSFDYSQLNASTSLENVFTSIGVGENTFAWDLCHTYYQINHSYGTQTIAFIPTVEQLEHGQKLWCRFIRTGSPQTVSANISNVKLHIGMNYIDNDAFVGCVKLGTEGLSYRLKADNTYAVAGMMGEQDVPGQALFIPSTYNGVAVTSIDAQAFRYQKICWAFFQPGLTEIGNRAFQFCYNLEVVNLSATSVTRFEDYTFDTCKLGFGDFDFPPNLTYIGEGAFIRTGEVSTLPSSITTIGDYAFAYSKEARTLTLPSSLISIGAYAFCETELPYTYDLPATVVTIGARAFKNSEMPSKFSLQANSALTTIGEEAFYHSRIETITIPATVTYIGANAFTANYKLTVYTECSMTNSPSGWNSSWNGSHRPVVWGCTLSSDKSRMNSFAKNQTNPQYRDAEYGMNNPGSKEYNFAGWYTTSDFSGTKYTDLADVPLGMVYAKWSQKSCVAEGTLITLADGSHVAVEDLTGEEELLVWNLLTGQFDSAPIIFVDSDPYTSYEITHLYFSDGTEVKVIDEHAFWDVNLNEYVFLRHDAAQYIGHWFNKQVSLPGGGMAWTTVQLVDVDVYQEFTTAWSPVTYGHLCFYVNDMLSMPGATEGLINIFEVDPLTMSYDAEAFAADIAEYGLFTYQEFAALIPIPEEVFYAFSGQYLKVSIGKGLITLEEIALLIERYSVFFA